MSTTQDSVMRGGTASMGNGSPGQGPKAQKKFILKKNKMKNAQNSNPTNKTKKSMNTAPTNRSFGNKSQNSLDHQNDPDNSGNPNLRNSNLTTQNLNENKEAPSLSNDREGYPIVDFSKNPPKILTGNDLISSDIFSYKPPKKLSRTAAYFKKRHSGNDQQRPKHLSQVSEAVWEVEEIEKIHLFVNPDGERIEAMGEVKWKNTLEPIANMQCNETIASSLDKWPVTIHFNDGTTKRAFIRYDKDKINDPDYFSNLLGSVNTFKGEIGKYNDKVIFEGWAKGEKPKNYWKETGKQKQRPMQNKIDLVDKYKTREWKRRKTRDYEKK